MQIQRIGGPSEWVSKNPGRFKAGAFGWPEGQLCQWRRGFWWVFLHLPTFFLPAPPWHPHK
jgi:hypothetical protein